MSKDFSRDFYDSVAWKNTRRAYASAKGGLCERCLRAGRYVAGEIVHHKRHLTPENIQDPRVALDWSNLELVCRECHAEIHAEDIHKGQPKRWSVDEFGRVTPR